MKEKSIIKKSNSFQWWFIIIATIFLIVMWFFATSNSQEMRECNSVIHDTHILESTIIVTQKGLLQLLKEYHSYSDTVTTYVKHWGFTDYCDTMTAISVPQEGTFMTFEGFIDWLESVKLK